MVDLCSRAVHKGLDWLGSKSEQVTACIMVLLYGSTDFCWRRCEPPLVWCKERLKKGKPGLVAGAPDGHATWDRSSDQRLQNNEGIECELVLSKVQMEMAGPLLA